MSQKNVAEIVRRKSDGAVYEVIGLTREQAFIQGMNFIRMGPQGEHRRKRRWVPIHQARTEFESATAPSEASTP